MIAIIDYKAGNLTSVKLACETLGLDAEITGDSEKILSAERVIFPGVGAAKSAMATLNELGLVDTIRKVAAAGTPFLGICLGTQIILEHSEENDGVDCIGLIKGNVVKFAPDSPYDKIPQMGWNSMQIKTLHPVLEGIEDSSEFYFVHSYYPVPADEGCVIGTTGYAGVDFASVIGQGNVIATQFHPEKSGRVGLKLLESFAKWNG
ncbi:imidazole glycerol phosphate synthase subunit HisH [bacterium E08(2017)]|nr:imidazole glycerol phosphate synthase subunit HisH [bacterium E08(2017)]